VNLAESHPFNCRNQFLAGWDPVRPDNRELA
jgi:hypothetical protein